ncbi:hypothetical protein SprV_0802558300 [Sparganum proliferum]
MNSLSGSRCPLKARQAVEQEEEDVCTCDATSSIAFTLSPSVIHYLSLSPPPAAAAAAPPCRPLWGRCALAPTLIILLLLLLVFAVSLRQTLFFSAPLSKAFVALPVSLRRLPSPTPVLSRRISSFSRALLACALLFFCLTRVLTHARWTATFSFR